MHVPTHSYTSLELFAPGYNILTILRYFETIQAPPLSHYTAYSSISHPSLHPANPRRRLVHLNPLLFILSPSRLHIPQFPAHQPPIPIVLLVALLGRNTSVSPRRSMSTDKGRVRTARRGSAPMVQSERCQRRVVRGMKQRGGAVRACWRALRRLAAGGVARWDARW
jgi:hypothetical protein